MNVVSKYRIFPALLFITSQVILSACSMATNSSVGSQTLKNSAVASLVLKNGAVYVMDENNTTATAVAVKGDIIVFVGSDDDVEQYIGQGTEVVDLAGKMLLPGFVDGHAHPPERELLELNNLMLGSLEPNLNTYRKALKLYAEEHADEPVLTASGLQLNLFDEIGLHKSFIDEIVSDKPVLLSDTSGHGQLVNTAALTMSNISRETQDPPGGKVYKDKLGEPTGYLSDASSVLHPDLSAPPEISTEVFMRAWVAYENASLSKGITAVTNALLLTMPASVIRPLIHDHIEAGNARMRVNFLSAAVPGKTTAEDIIQELNSGQQYVSDWQMVSGVKTFLDGVPEGKSAYLLEPYAPTAGVAADYRGTPNWTSNEYNQFVAELDGAGYQVQAHAMGDASARMFVDAVEHAYTQNKTREARHTLVHANLVALADIQRMGKMDVYAAISPVWSYEDPIFGSMELKMLGQERYDLEYRLRDMIVAGVQMTGSADQPVTPDDRPLVGIETGVTRSSPYPGEQKEQKFIRNASQSISVIDMLRIYTINGAKQMFMDHLIGSLELGKKADMVILSADITKINPMDISETEVVTTIVDGKTVYQLDSIEAGL